MYSALDVDLRVASAWFREVPEDDEEEDDDEKEDDGEDEGEGYSE